MAKTKSKSKSKGKRKNPKRVAGGKKAMKTSARKYGKKSATYKAQRAAGSAKAAGR